MTGIAATLLLQAALLSTGSEAYTVAYRSSVESGKPILIYVGADWCPACQSLKNTTLAQMKRNGQLSGVSFVELNTDADPQLARQVMSGGSIPQLVLYSRSGDGWGRSQLIGFQSVEAVQRLIRPAVRSRAVANKVKTAKVAM